MPLSLTRASVAGMLRGNRQDGGEALVDAPVKRPLAPPLDLPPLLRGQDYRFHGWLLRLLLGSFRSPFPLEVAHCTRRFSFGDGIPPPDARRRPGPPGPGRHELRG